MSCLDFIVGSDHDELTTYKSAREGCVSRNTFKVSLLEG